MTMQPVDCARCGNRVLVEKTSWQHTSVQWLTDAAQSCAEFNARSPSDAAKVRVGSCTALKESIKQAALDGRIPVPDD